MDLIRCIAAFGIAQQRDNVAFVDWLFLCLSSIDPNVDFKLLFFQILAEVLKMDTNKYYQNHTDLIMTNTKLILQDTYSEEIVKEILRVFGSISVTYPFTFGSHFQDVVDLLLGWLVDVDTTGGLASAIHAAFLEFRPFWLQNAAFGMEMLKQFLEDLTQSIEDHPFPQDKCSTLLKCFHSIVNPICGGLAPVQGTEMVATKLLQVLTNGQAKAQTISWNNLGNDLLTIMIPAFPGMTTAHSLHIVTFLLGQFSQSLTADELASPLATLSLVTADLSHPMYYLGGPIISLFFFPPLLLLLLFLQLLATPRISLTTQALRSLLNPFSTLLSLRLHSSEAVVAKMKKLVREIMYEVQMFFFLSCSSHVFLLLRPLVAAEFHNRELRFTFNRSVNFCTRK